ncbi:MAG TPA: hypothetical protein VIH57_08145 [Bacteroidales bacterium]
MRIILSITAATLFTLCLSAQNTGFYKVKTSPSNSLYIGFNNPIELTDSTQRDLEKTFILKSDNGLVARRNNVYYLLPARTGETVLKVFQAKGKDTVLWGQQTFKVKPVYMPVMALSGKVLDSTISKSEIMKEQHFRVMMPECDYAVRFALTNCKVRFSNGMVYNASQGVIGLNIKKELSHTKPGTKICFEEIKILEFTGAERKLDDACYVLTE